MLLLALWLTSSAVADPQPTEPSSEPEGTPPAEGAEKGEEEVETLLPPFDVGQALEVEDLSRKQYLWLKPYRGRLPQVPRGQTDFTAYTLEWGEVKIGLGLTSFGVLPRTQIGTVPILDILGIYNGTIKVNALRAGPVDAAVLAMYYHLPLGDFTGRYLGVGGMVSMRITAGLSIHTTAFYAWTSASGMPDPAAVSPIIDWFSGGVIRETEIPEEVNDFLDLSSTWLDVKTVTIRLASDYRFNRRDAIVLQAQTQIWANGHSELGDEFIPAVLGLDRALSSTGPVNITEWYSVSLSYQATFKQLDLRIGLGYSADKYAWLFQAFEVGWRMGGPTRRREGRQRRAWRKNRKLLDD
jgi:hypothetical protein